MPKVTYVERSGGQIPLHALGCTKRLDIIESLSDRGKTDGITNLTLRFRDRNAKKRRFDLLI